MGKRDIEDLRLKSPKKFELSNGVTESKLKRGIINLSPKNLKSVKIHSSPGKSRNDIYRITKRQIEKQFIVNNDDPLSIFNSKSSSLAPPKLKQNISTPRINKRLIDYFSPSSNNNGSPTKSGGRNDYFSFPELDNAFKPTEYTASLQKLIDDRESKELDTDFKSASAFSDGYEGHFNQNRLRRKHISSTNTMHKLSLDLDYEQFNLLYQLEKLLIPNIKYNHLFNQFYFELLNGFNLHFYGVGSKLKFIHEFYNDYLLSIVSCPILVINGYNPSTNIKEVLQQLITILFPAKNAAGKKQGSHPPTNNLNEFINILKNKFHENKPSLKLIIIINNFDSEYLRNHKFQYLFNELFKLKQFLKFIITTDIYFSSILLSSYLQFTHHNITNYCPYFIESSFKDFLNNLNNNSNNKFKGSKYVLNSLTLNARNLYKILIMNQLENDSPIEFKKLYELCVDEFITSNEISFRIMLREFIEHDMIKVNKNNQGLELISIELSNNELQELLEELL